MMAAKHILRYLIGTRSYKITFDGSSNAGLIGYSDSDWAENKDDRHSTTGFVYFMANAPVAWVSRQQKTMALSSTEAEYMALSDASRQCAWLRSMQHEIGYTLTNPTPICSDNNGSIFLAVNPAHDHRTKHINIHYHYISLLKMEMHQYIILIQTIKLQTSLQRTLTESKQVDL
jgi:hypothetical protein